METKQSDTSLPRRTFFCPKFVLGSGERNSGCNSKEEAAHVFIKAAGRRNELLVYWDEKEYILAGAKNENKLLAHVKFRARRARSDHLFKFVPAL